MRYSRRYLRETANGYSRALSISEDDYAILYDEVKSFWDSVLNGTNEYGFNEELWKDAAENNSNTTLASFMLYNYPSKRNPERRGLYYALEEHDGGFARGFNASHYRGDREYTTSALNAAIRTIFRALHIPSGKLPENSPEQRIRREHRIFNPDLATKRASANESRRFRGRRLNERKSYSVFADGGRGGRDERRDFGSEEEAGRFADSLDKRKFKGYRISDPEGDVIASRTYLHGKREIFTYSLCNIDEETGDHETYYESNPFYDFDECCDAAKEAVKKETEPVISFVFAGEYEKDNGDIYGDTTAVLAISNTRSVNADEYV